MNENLVPISIITKEDKLIFIEIMKKYKSVIENKITDAIGKKEKAKAWDKITEEFNRSIPIGNRTQKTLQSLWKNLKYSAKKHYALTKRETYLTGSGKLSVRPDILAEKVHEIIGLSIEGLQYPFDSDEQLSSQQINSTLMENEENIDPNADDPDDPIFEYLLNEGEINDWSRWNPRKLKKPISNPLSKAISGGAGESSKTVRTTNYNELQINLLQKKK
ncbi:myb/SANT-like DNA-binding domain-containing protein 3 [Prorops nasuta]|uniref:myb/SANT-like DNA-binding domain-containing protein 3 n=1 Tax=Prorops nasuta TaxID=863751 RepID=UPI0034CE21C3